MLLWEQAHSNNVMAPSDNQAGDVQAASSSQTPSRIQLACPKCGQTKVLDFASTAFPQNLLCEHVRLSFLSFPPTPRPRFETTRLQRNGEEIHTDQAAGAQRSQKHYAGQSSKYHPPCHALHLPRPSSRSPPLTRQTLFHLCAPIPPSPLHPQPPTNNPQCRHPTRNAFALPPASPTQQETDLAAAFARTLSLEHRPSLWSPPPRPALTDRGDGSQVHYLARAPSAWPPAKPTAPVYASVHYTHSAHLQPAAAEPYMREGYGRGGGDGDVEMGG